MLLMAALRRSPGRIDRHTQGRHHRLQAAFCAEPVQLVCVRPALLLEQQFCIVPVATMGVGEIRRMRHRRTGAAPRRGRSEECRACGWSSSSFLSSELTQRPIITQPRRRRHPDTASPCCAGRPCASRTTPAAASSPDGPSGSGPPVEPSGLGRGADESSARGHQSGARARVGQPNAGVRTVGPVSPTEQRHVSASVANYGWRRSVPHATGVAVGFPIMPILVASDLERVLQVFPFVMEIFDWAGSTMMVWYAWRRATQHAARAPSLQCLVKLTARARTGAVQPDTPAPSAPARAPDAD